MDSLLSRKIKVLQCDKESVVIDNPKELEITIDEKTTIKDINGINYFTKEWNIYMEIRTPKS